MNGSKGSFTLSCFGDEISTDLKEELQVLRGLKIGFLELRSVWGKNVLDLENDEVERVRQICSELSVRVSCIGSPVGKSPISAPLDQETNNLARIFQIAEKLNTRRIRIFSFYPPDTSSNLSYDQYIHQASERLAHLTRLAQREGFSLLLENEKGVVGDIPERCQAILRAVDSPNLRFTWDPANFVQVGLVGATEHGWPLLGQYVSHVHVKDAVLGGSVRPAGEGDGQVKELLKNLDENGYRGFLSLEPHLDSGAEGMIRATAALRKLLAELGIPA